MHRTLGSECSSQNVSGRTSKSLLFWLVPVCLGGCLLPPAPRAGIPASEAPGEAHSSFWLGRGRGGAERRMVAFLPPLHVAQPWRTQAQSAAV